MSLAAIAAMILALNGCQSNMKIETYANEHPTVSVREYFNGPIKAWGLIQNRKGDVTTRFDVEMMGTWDGDTGTLEEDFRYYDGREQKRVWTIKELESGQFSGSASDIVGTATGEQKGNALRWNYQMDIEVDGRTYRIQFDDWMWLMNDGILINRSYLKKFGFTVAELTLFMQKTES
jgi:hypothetical protein